MGIQEEREAFEAWFESRYDAHFMQFTLDLDMYVDKHTQTCWEAWQVAKAQAVSEVLKKFCNEHKDPAWRGRLTEYDKGYSDCCIAVLEMIEAQEQS